MIKNMKKIVLWLFIITVVSFSISMVLFTNAGVNIRNLNFKNIGISNVKGKFQEDIDVEKAFDILDIEDINVNTVSNDITFIPEDRDDIKFHFYGSVASNAPIILPEMITKKQNKTLKVEIDYKNFVSSGYYSSNIKLDIYIPNKYSKDIYIETTSGDINLGRLSINNMNLMSVSGDIKAKALYTKQTKLKSTSGDIKIEDFKGELGAKTVSGDFAIGIQSLDNDLSLKSTSGDVKIQLPEKAEFYLESKSISGDISCEPLISIRGNLSDNELKGRVGNGGAKVTISTVSGDIEISEKEAQ